MPRSARRRVVGTDPVQRVCLVVLGILALLAVVAVISPAQGLAMLFNVLYMAMLAVPAYVFTRGTTADATGIHCRRWFAGPLLIPWHLVEHVDAESSLPSVQTAFGRLDMSPRAAAEAHRLWRQRRARDASEADATVDRLDPEMVRGWLGLEDGGELEGRDSSVAGRSANLAAGCFALSSLSLVGCLVAAIAGGREILVLAAQILPVMLVTGLVARQQQRMARVGFVADDQSIEFVDATGAEHRVGWNDVMGISHNAGWVLHSRVGEVRLPPTVPHLPQLEAAVQQAIEARGRGEVLPRLANAVPDTALSRPELGPGDERGLSRSEGG